MMNYDEDDGDDDEDDGDDDEDEVEDQDDDTEIQMCHCLFILINSSLYTNNRNK